ncbi:MAG: hypothetical protein KBA51_05590 [Kiritimatiellae bacterium]|nr:hypothetical protein [Kiritimatiellia bacterium]
MITQLRSAARALDARVVILFSKGIRLHARLSTLGFQRSPDMGLAW